MYPEPLPDDASIEPWVNLTLREVLTHELNSIQAGRIFYFDVFTNDLGRVSLCYMLRCGGSVGALVVGQLRVWYGGMAGYSK